MNRAQPQPLSQTTATAGRVWLVATLSGAEPPADRPAVRDDLMRTWLPDQGGSYRSQCGRRQATWAELHARYDLVEVSLNGPGGRDGRAAA